MLDAHGTKGPAEIPAKRAYLFRDAYRKAHRLGLPPLRLPPSHPFNPLLALRGVFGDPMVIVDGELFWGTDGLEHVEAFLRGEDPVPKDTSCADRPVSAMRKAARPR